MRKRFLISLLAAITLPTAINAGIPQSKNVNKWMRVDPTLMVDTEDVDVKKGKLRFFIKRNYFQMTVQFLYLRIKWE